MRPSYSSRLAKEWRRLLRRVRNRFRLSGAFAADRRAEFLAGLQHLASLPQERCLETLSERLMALGSTPPLVSVIIPMGKDHAAALRTLASLGASLDGTPMEIILTATEDGPLPLCLEPCMGARFLASAEPRTFAEASNHAATEARGRFLQILPAGRAVLPGWLPPLLTAFQISPEAGLVGSDVLGPDFTRVEPSREAPWEPSTSFLHPSVETATASCLILRESYLSVGGMDPTILDARSAVRSLGRRLYVKGMGLYHQPRSRIFLPNPRTPSTPATTKPGDQRPSPFEHASSNRILILDLTTPTPDRDSGSLDMVNALRIYRELGFRVTYLPTDRFRYDGAYTEALQADGVECHYEPFTSDVGRFLKARGSEFIAVILSRAPTAIRYLEAVRRYCPSAKVIFNTVDLHFLRLEREASLAKSAAKAREAASLKTAELACISQADATIVLSTVEADILAHEAPGSRVVVIPLIREIPGRTSGFLFRRGCVFVGGFRHSPNVDAANQLIRDIWPLVRVLDPELELSIIGDGAPNHLIAEAGNGITFLGHVPDLAPHLGRARLSVVPLRFGAGLKGKIASSLGYGVPCVSSAIGIEGSGLIPDREILLAEDPQTFADAIVRLHRDEVLWNRLSDAGLAFVQREYGLDANRWRFRELFSGLGLPVKGRFAQ